MKPDPLRTLEKLRNVFHKTSGREKRLHMGWLARTRLRSAAEVERLHEILCFVRAYPDDARTLAAASRMLRAFARRADLRRHADSLENSGIAGTAIRYSSFVPAIARRTGPSPGTAVRCLAGSTCRSAEPGPTSEARSAAGRRAYAASRRAKGHAS